MSVVGGLLGGLLGSQVGAGKGRQAAIGVGSAVGAVLGSDCSADNAVRTTVTTPRIGESRINGIPVGNGGVFSLGRLSGLPLVQTTQDLKDLDLAVREAQALARARLEVDDYGGAMMATHFASLLLEYQALIGISNDRVFESMKSMRDGRTTIPAESYAVLPLFDRGGYTHHEKVEISFRPLESGEPILVASNGLLTGIMSALPKQPNNTASLPMAATEYATLPIGMIVTFANGLVMKRTADSIVVHNPKNVDLDAELEKMGYMPPIPMPSKHRQDAGRIMKNMTDSSNIVFLRRASGEAWPKAPNLIVDGHTQTGLLNANGLLSKSGVEDAAGKKLYANPKSSYRLAMDTLVGLQGVQEWHSFRNACNGDGRFNTSSLNAVGQHGEIAAFLCGSGRNVGSDIFSRQFYIGENGLHQTIESIMKDESVAQGVKQYSLDRELASNLIQMVPVVGSLESGTKCVDSSLRIGDLYASRLGTSEKMKAASFVKHIYNPEDLKEGGFSKTLDCLSAIPAAGLMVKGSSKAMELTVGLKGYISKAADDFHQVSRLFDNGLVNGSKYAVLAEKASKYGDAWATTALMSKYLYDNVQRVDSYSDIAGSLRAVQLNEKEMAAR
ncbi:MAG: hypothetical protein B7X91_11390 [Hydrogenophilales bacterium 17-64-11]|nr:MAG: hypothetical protein B7X91_11390 [Hydrogenophilales bacterium 17-64-11]